MAKGGKRTLWICFIFLGLVITGLFITVIMLALEHSKDSGTTDCHKVPGTNMSISKPSKDPYGNINGKDVFMFTLKNSGKTEVKIINYGATITNVLVPDRNGTVEDIALGFDSLQEYEDDSLYFGCVVGRYANRIAKGKFTLDGTEYELNVNNGPNALHGGPTGFQKRVWDPEIVDNTLVLSYTSRDGEEHYPGEVKVTVTFRLTDENELVIDYRANTTKPTVINLTNHAYFNLAGQSSGRIDEHQIRVDAEKYTPLDGNSIPTGEIASVDKTMYDLRVQTPFGPRIPQIPGGTGFDINYALGRPGWDKHVAKVVHRPSGRSLDLYSTEPGVQVYTAFYLENVKGKNGAIYNKYDAFCLEAQHYPDSPNKALFPTTILRPGEEYKQTTKYVFGTQS